jgi:predicted Zn-dependent protease
MATRLALAALALVALAFLAVGLRAVVLGERGQRLAASPRLDPAELAEAERLLERARLLNPDTRLLLAQGGMLVAHGQRRRGLELIERAVRHEPENVFAWGVLAGATRRSDPMRSRQAQARVRELSPAVRPE